MIRTFAATTAIAAALIALSPMQTVAQVNVPPQSKVNVAPNVPNVPTPRVNRPDVAPEPNTSRVRLPDDEEEEAEPTQSTGTADAPEPEAPKRSAPRTAANPQDDGPTSLAGYAPIPPVFPETLAKAAPHPPEKPERVALIDPDGASDDESGNLGDAAELDEDEAPGLGGDEMQVGEDAADRLRERFHAGLALELERAEQLARLRKIRELGGLEVGLGDASRDQDCGPGVNVPAGADLHGLGCGSGDESAPEPSTDPRGDAGPGYPFDPRDQGGRYPRPSPEDGMGGNRKHPGAWIGEGSGSAKGTVRIKDFGQGQAHQGGGAVGAGAGSSSGSGEDSGDDTTVEVEVLPDGGTKETVKDGEDNVEEVTIRDANGNTMFKAERNDDGTYTQSSYVVTFDDGSELWSVTKADNPFGASKGGEFVTFSPTGSAGGESGQPDPRGDPQGTGGAGADCLMLGIRCAVAESESGETWGEKMKEWARQIGPGHDMLTPKKAMEQAGQPLPVPGRDSATGGTADPRGVAGLSPCFNAPVGCGNPYAEGAAGANEAAEPGDLGLDTSISGLTPPCVNNPGGCAGSGTAAESAAETSAGGETAR